MVFLCGPVGDVFYSLITDARRFNGGLLDSLTSPTKPSSKTCSEVMALLCNHLQPTPLLLT